MRIVLSSDAESKSLPEGWKTSARIQLSCPAWQKDVSRASVQRQKTAYKVFQHLSTLSIPKFDCLVSRPRRNISTRPLYAIRVLKAV